MSEKIRCAVCNNLFEPCERCLRLSPIYGEINQWRRVVCCPEHFSYHMPIILYIREKISKDKAKKDLQMVINEYGMIDFNDNVKGIVDEILAEDKSSECVAATDDKIEASLEDIVPLGDTVLEQHSTIDVTESESFNSTTKKRKNKKEY